MVYNSCHATHERLGQIRSAPRQKPLACSWVEEDQLPKKWMVWQMFSAGKLRFVLTLFLHSDSACRSKAYQSYRQKHQTARSERLPCLCDGKHDQGCHECCKNLQRFFVCMCENRIRDDPNVRMTHAWGNCTRLR